MNFRDKILNLLKAQKSVTDETLKKFVVEVEETENISNETVEFVFPFIKPFIIVLNNGNCIGKIWISETAKNNFLAAQKKLDDEYGTCDEE